MPSKTNGGEDLRRNLLLGAAFVTLALLVLAGANLVSPPPAASPAMPANPVPSDAGSRAAGEALYRQHCQSCHGVEGHGDGPLGVALNPRPADLSHHMALGMHPDGQVFLWISAGVEGSPMPAFQEVLSEEERWHLVNFIRTFAMEH
jgi:mono/diheme cytochrome c family protein